MRTQFTWLQAEWPAPPNIHTASTLRLGGLSRPPFDELNLGAHVGDVAAAVQANRQRLTDALQLPSEPCWLAQVHGSCVVDAPCWPAPQWPTPPQADACIARSAGVVCAVLTADCLPVLLCNRPGDRVAAAHAGWRGLVNGILESTVASLGVPGAQLMAWLGPAIGPAAFEVGDEVRIAFIACDAAAAQAFTASDRPGHWRADLYLLARQALARQGVTAVYGGGFCTHSDTARFFSYRRDGRTGRMASLIWMG